MRASFRPALLSFVLLATTSAAAADLVAAEREVDRLLKQLLSPPVPKAPPGYSARVISAPGEVFYDPLYMVVRGNEVWVNDDGGQKGDKGSQIVALDRQGTLKRLIVPVGTVTPVEGMDVAPGSFGDFAGHIFTASQSGVDNAGSFLDTIVHRIDPQTGAVSTFCTLPRITETIPSGWPAQGVFGPPGSPFDGRFIVVAGNNNTLYQITPDGRCKPFVTLTQHRLGRITFAPDGASILVSTSRGDVDRLARYRASTASSAQQGIAEGGPLIREILRVTPDGKVAADPVAIVDQDIGQMRYAPAGFGAYGGRLFFTVRGPAAFAPGMPRPLAQAIRPDGAVYRLTSQGKTEVFVSGLINPATLTFLDEETLWIGNEGHQFYQRELPDGAIVEVRTRTGDARGTDSRQFSEER